MRNLGATVGCIDLDGDSLGALLGLSVGKAEGDPVGLGETVGCKLTDGIKEREGEALGSRVGASLGEGDGAGLSVGVSLGAADGSLVVGASVGTVVGRDE